MIINLTQDQATPDQIAAGVVDLPQSGREAMAELLTFSRRESIEQVQQDGSVRKTNVLKHAGFVEARK